MSYFQPFIDEIGIHMPTYEDRLEDLITSYHSIFGDDVVLDESTPDYQLLSVFARALDDTSALVLDVFNSRNPSFAKGVALDYMLPQYGIVRTSASYSYVTLTLTGVAGIVIPAGSVVSDSAGRLWDTIEDVTLSSEGSGSVRAYCEVSGPIYAAAGTITTIVSVVSGWSGVTNSVSTSGRNEETDAELRVRLGLSMASKGAATIDNMVAALKEIPYVSDVVVYVNDTSSIDNHGIPAHSVAVVIIGGSASRIRKAIFNKKAPGIGTYGTTSGSVTDGQGIQHTISYSSASMITVSIEINIKSVASGFNYSEIASSIKAAVLSYVQGLKIAESLQVSRLFGICFGAVSDELRSTFIITSINTSSTGGAHSDIYPCAWNEKLTTYNSMIAVTEVT